MTMHIATTDRSVWAKLKTAIKHQLYLNNPAYRGKRMAEVYQDVTKEFNAMNMIEIERFVRSNEIRI